MPFGQSENQANLFRALKKPFSVLEDELCEAANELHKPGGQMKMPIIR